MKNKEDFTFGAGIAEIIGRNSDARFFMRFSSIDNPRNIKTQIDIRDNGSMISYNKTRKQYRSSRLLRFLLKKIITSKGNLFIEGV